MMQLNPIPKLLQFFSDSKRMINISYKPTITDFKRTLKIVLFGTILLGIIGYIISILVGLIA